MKNSLLAHLYPYIKGSQEDIATYSLQYLLLQSKEINKAFTKRISDVLHVDIEDTLQYVCQVTGKSEEKERPDMAGLDSIGNETVLFEMKFYATLTINQPNKYLDRLIECNGKGLLFICPTARQTNLWAKLNELCEGRNIEVIDEHCIKVDGISLGIITWTEIIEMLKQVASAVAINFTSDIAQLEGYCEQLDREAFIPFTASDLSAEMANRGERYYDILDEIVELFCADKKYKVSKKGLKATAYRKGYVRYLYIDEFAISLNYDRDMWKTPECVETPFWFSVRDKEWDMTDELIKKHSVFAENKKQWFWGQIFLALEPLQNSTFAEVCEDIKNQMERYIAIVKG
ncbi:MAG: hypothetical protein UH080_05370 [Ruminococcus sp.]|nr:hypothetical protein [Ruminococcus sp.]